MSAQRQCPACKVWTFNADHECAIFDGPPCETCQEPTGFYTVGAPGTGSGRACPNGHYHSIIPTRILTIGDVR